MDSINANVSIDTQSRKKKALRNGAIGTAAGAIIGSGVGFYATKTSKNGVPTDQFVRDVAIEYILDTKKLKDKSFSEKLSIDAKFTKIDKLSSKDNYTKEEVKTILENNKKVFKKELKELNNGNLEKSTENFNNMVKKYNNLRDIVKEELIKLNKSKEPYSNIIVNPKVSVMADIVEIATKNANSIKYGAIAAVGLGLVSFFATKLINNNASNENKQ